MARSRHKGAKPVDMAGLYVPFSPDAPVARAIASGDNWLRAWSMQFGGWGRAPLSRERMEEVVSGAPVLASEIAAIADSYGVPADDIIASLPDQRLLVPDVE